MALWKSLLASLTLMLIYVSSAGAAVIDFNSAPLNMFLDNGDTYTEADFTITQTASPGSFGLFGQSSSCDPSCSDNGTTWLMQGNPVNGAFFTVTRSGGGAFSMLGFDGAESFAERPESWADAIQVIGNLVGGGQVTATFALDQINDGAGGVADFQSFLLPATFANLQSVEFRHFGTEGSENFIIDNINTVAVAAPEPSSIALLGVGLAVFGIFRQRKKA
jgi:hypothetical protein